MTKFVYSECLDGQFPSLFTIEGYDYKGAVLELIEIYSNQFENEGISEFSEFEELQDYLSTEYNCVISDLYKLDEF